MCGPLALPIALVASAAIAGGASIYAAGKQASATKAAMAQNAQLATQQAANEKALSDRAINAANQKQSDFATMSATNLRGASGGVGSTMLTGPGGAAVNNSILGRTTLLGG